MTLERIIARAQMWLELGSTDAALRVLKSTGIPADSRPWAYTDEELKEQENEDATARD